MDKLTGCHPLLIEKVKRILSAMDALGWPMMVTAGVRSIEEQQLLFAQGRTSPGKIVTMCDGVKKPSNHQPKSDGLGHAADLVFIVDGKPSWDLKLHWDLLGEMAMALGLTWGGSWANIHDMPHVELRDVA